MCQIFGSFLKPKPLKFSVYFGLRKMGPFFELPGSPRGGKIFLSFRPCYCRLKDLFRTPYFLPPMFVISP